MSCRSHFVLSVDQERALGWLDREVARRWMKLFGGTALVRSFAAGEQLSEAQLAAAALKIDPAAYIKFINRSEKSRFSNFIGPVEAMRTLADHFGKSFLSSPYSPLCRSEGLRGPVVGAFRERAHRKRTRLYVEDARPSETPWTRGLAAPQ